MTTPEKDVELEKFIEEQTCCGEDFRWFTVNQICHNVAAFAAKRAREKAIEEYHAKMMNWLTGRGIGSIAQDLNAHMLKSL